MGRSGCEHAALHALPPRHHHCCHRATDEPSQNPSLDRAHPSDVLPAQVCLSGHGGWFAEGTSELWQTDSLGAESLLFRFAF